MFSTSVVLGYMLLHAKLKVHKQHIHTPKVANLKAIAATRSADASSNMRIHMRNLLIRDDPKLLDNGGEIPKTWGRGWQFDSQLWNVLSTWWKLARWWTASRALAMACRPFVSKFLKKCKLKCTHICEHEDAIKCKHLRCELTFIRIRTRDANLDLKSHSNLNMNLIQFDFAPQAIRVDPSVQVSLSTSKLMFQLLVT